MTRKSPFSRRELLRTGAAVAAAATLPSWLGSATAQTKPKNLVIVFNAGGWDTSYALDPKPGSTIVDSPPGTLERFAEIPVLVDASRPKVRAFFERHAARTLLINGVQVRSFIHTDCTKRILTGTPSDSNPDFGAIAAFEHGRELPVPYLVLGNSALSGPLASITGRAGTTNQIAALLSPEAAYSDPGSNGPSPGLEPTAAEESLARRYLEASTERLRATRGLYGSNARQVDAFKKSLERARLFRDFAASQPGLSKREYTPDIEVQMEIAVTALRGGLCHSVLLQTSGWDTHDDNTEQTERHESLFGALSTLVDKLDQERLSDSTLLVVLSEMGRTPKLNAGGGKDHWPVTSALVFGAGVRGGRVLGATDDSLGALSLNLGSGTADPNGRQLQTGNLVAGLLEYVGVDPAPHFPEVEPLRAFT